MNYTEYWKTVSPHIRQIKLATIEYLDSIRKDVEDGHRGKVQTSMELFNFCERFEKVMGDISDTAFNIAQSFHLSCLHAIQTNTSLEFPRHKKFKRKLKVLKGEKS